MASGGGPGGGSGGNGDGSGRVIGACLRLQKPDPAGTPSVIGPTTYGGTYGAKGGAGVFIGAQRNSQYWDTVDWFTPGMVDLAVNDRIIKIVEDGVYDIDAIIEFNTVSTENILAVFLNGYDSVGSHTGGVPATDGLEPTTGEFISQFGFTAGPASALLQTHTKLALHKGDFVFAGHQCDVNYALNQFTNPHYLDRLPQFSVVKVGDIP
jgi:hypothetical protein